jgi:hypothetical protein
MKVIDIKQQKKQSRKPETDKIIEAEKAFQELYLDSVREISRIQEHLRSELIRLMEGCDPGAQANALWRLDGLNKRALAVMWCGVGTALHPGLTGLERKNGAA